MSTEKPVQSQEIDRIRRYVYECRQKDRLDLLIYSGNDISILLGRIDELERVIADHPQESQSVS